MRNEIDNKYNNADKYKAECDNKVKKKPSIIQRTKWYENGDIERFEKCRLW